ncbi:Putative transposase of IS4/5 family (DUF4096) [Desulfocurvibacter africanus PCS]|uniref:Putative transposase of IS4/5 family (DUF4096) n=1 Tax=Desulfocurvibacter africanus PCS TaxID=1262666 RepID=M5PR72_DESAF|nr:Putative transposase of IS4/5 family (DUF4096) [Desulfocurvibacter africanus PCS]
MGMKRNDLTKRQCEQIKDLLPPTRGRPGKPAKDNHLMLNAMLWILTPTGRTCRRV